jgi:23S rRNA (guanosine2251-2'-O)-methyltransferase
MPDMVEPIYGRRPVYEVLRAGRRRVYRLALAENIQEQQEIIRQIMTLARSASVPVTRSSRRDMDQVAPNHQGIIAEATSYPYVDLDDALSFASTQDTPPLFLLLDLLQDPQNVGSLFRTAEAVGVHVVIIPERRAVGVTPAVVSASAGAVEHLRVVRVTNLARTMEALKRRDVWIAGLEVADEAQLYDQADLRGPLALVVGGEGRGVRRLVRESCDFLLRLPMRGEIASLNAAVAGSVALYEIDRQRRADQSST